MLDQAFSCIWATVEQYILDELFQLRINLFVDLEHASVDDAHVHARTDCVIEKRRVHGFANFVVTSKTERYVRNPAADLRMGQVSFDPSSSVDEVNRVIVMLLHAGRYREDVRIEDDVFWRESNLIDQNAIGTLADADLVFIGSGLTIFVKGHYHYGRTIFQNCRGVLAKLFFAFFQRDRVNNPLSLQALKPRLDDLPLRGVHHKRHLSHFRFTRQQLQIARHGNDA